MAVSVALHEGVDIFVSRDGKLRRKTVGLIGKKSKDLRRGMRCPQGNLWINLSEGSLVRGLKKIEEQIGRIKAVLSY